VSTPGEDDRDLMELSGLLWLNCPADSYSTAQQLLKKLETSKMQGCMTCAGQAFDLAPKVLLDNDCHNHVSTAGRPFI